MYISEPIRLSRVSQDFESRLSQLSRVAGAYVLRSSGIPLHLSWSTNLERRLRRLLLSSYRDSLRLGDKLDAVECWPAGSKLELQLTLYTLAREIHPQDYQKFLKLRLPWCLGFTNDCFPRLETTNRTSAKYRALWGPFPSRADAQQYEQEVLGLFQIRRCVEALAPTHDHPGCIYGEMNQCLRPCQQAVSPGEYAAEVERAGEFLMTNGRSQVAALISARERACESAEFEQAAQIHKRIERLKEAGSWRDAVVAKLDNFNGVALTRALEPHRATLWVMFAGYWQKPITLAISAERAEVRSLDSEVREQLSTVLTSPRMGGNRLEELSLFARWYFSSWRDGDWFPFTSVSNLNYRKLIRELSKLAHNPCPFTKK